MRFDPFIYFQPADAERLSSSSGVRPPRGKIVMDGARSRYYDHRV
jgi:hypothetical protein